MFLGRAIYRRKKLILARKRKHANPPPLLFSSLLAGQAAGKCRENLCDHSLKFRNESDPTTLAGVWTEARRYKEVGREIYSGTGMKFQRIARALPKNCVVSTVTHAAENLTELQAIVSLSASPSGKRKRVESHFQRCRNERFGDMRALWDLGRSHEISVYDRDIFAEKRYFSVVDIRVLW